MDNKKDKKNRKAILLIVLALLIISSIPVKQEIKDGGSIRYRAILYSVTKVHQLPMELDGDYITGIRVNILGIPVYDNTK